MPKHIKVILTDAGELTAQIVASHPYGERRDRFVTITIDDLAPAHRRALVACLAPILAAYVEEIDAQVSIAAEEASEEAEHEHYVPADDVGLTGHLSFRQIDPDTHEVVQRGSHRAIIRKK